MKPIFVIVILFFGVFVFYSADSYAHEDLTTRLVDVYSNYTGELLIKTEAAHDSPGGWLRVGSYDNYVTNPAARMMYATALVAIAAGKTCWVRVVPTDAGYWIADRISIKSE